MSSAPFSKAYIDAMAQADTLSRLTGTLRSTVAQREYERASQYATLSERLTKSLGLPANIRDYALDFAAITSAKSLHNALASSVTGDQFAHLNSAERMKRMLEDAFGGATSLVDYAKALDITKQVKKLGTDLSINSKAQEYLSTLRDVEQSTKDRVLGAVGGVAHLSEPSYSGSAEWIRQLSTAMTERDLYQRLMGSATLAQSFSSDHLSSVGQLARDRYESLFSAQEAWKKQVGLLTRPAYLDVLLRTLEQDASPYDASLEDYDEEPVNAESAELLLNQLGQAETPERFAEVLNESPAWLKWALVNFLVFVVLPFVIGISVNLATPYVQAYLDDSPPAAAREQVKGIRTLSMGELGAAVSTYRFVTAQKLLLRRSANSRAEQVDVLHFGQVVAVLSSKRDWTEVTYEYGDGTLVSGWVYTRYLQKFRR